MLNTITIGHYAIAELAKPILFEGQEISCVDGIITAVDDHGITLDKGLGVYHFVAWHMINHATISVENLLLTPSA
jgi:hypothetical protein